MQPRSERVRGVRRLRRDGGRSVVVCAVLTSLLLPSLTAAQEPALDEETAVPEVDAEPIQYQVTFPRLWFIGVPGFVLDAFFAAHTNHWQDGVANMAVGGEFIVRRPNQYDLVFSLDWANLRTADGYWLEDGDPVRDTDWTESNLSMLALDTAIHWVQPVSVDGAFQIYYGLGLGLGVILGEFVKWDVLPGCLDGQQNTDNVSLLDDCFDESGDPYFDRFTRQVEDRIPRIFPAFSATLGARYIIDGQWALGVELGVKTIYLYAGLEAGYVF